MPITNAEAFLVLFARGVGCYAESTQNAKTAKVIALKIRARDFLDSFFVLRADGVGGYVELA